MTELTLFLFITYLVIHELRDAFKDILCATKESKLTIKFSQK